MANINYKELDDDWISEFQKSDKLYKDFYKDDVYFLNIHFIYVNKCNEIELVKHENFLMSEKNYIKRDELLRILKNNNVIDNTKYSILSILRYNITMSPEDILTFFKNETQNENRIDDYIFIVKNIDDIKFEKTINTFQDLNDLFFIFYEKELNKEKSTHNITKKIYFKTRPLSNGKKTIRKRYKE